MQRLTGDYPAASATLQQAQQLNRDPSDRYKQAWVCNEIGVVQRLTGDYPAAGASHQRAIEQFGDLGDQPGQAIALDALGLVQQLTGDSLAAAASHRQALRLLRGERHERAQVLNSLGELASRTSATHQARDYHGQALVIASDICVPLEEARALEGIGHSHLQDGDPSQATTHLQQALAIYQRIGSPDARRVYETLSQYGLQVPTQLPRLRIWRHTRATSIQLPAAACDRLLQRNGRAALPASAGVARAESQKAMFPMGIFRPCAVIRAASYLGTSATVAQAVHRLGGYPSNTRAQNLQVWAGIGTIVPRGTTAPIGGYTRARVRSAVITERHPVPGSTSR